MVASPPRGVDIAGDSMRTDPCAVSARGEVSCQGGVRRFQGIDTQQMSSSISHTCVVAANRTVFCRGQNGSGQLGDHTETDRPTPVRVLK